MCVCAAATCTASTSAALGSFSAGLVMSPALPVGVTGDVVDVSFSCQDGYQIVGGVPGAAVNRQLTCTGTGYGTAQCELLRVCVRESERSHARE